MYHIINEEQTSQTVGMFMTVVTKECPKCVILSSRRCLLPPFSFLPVFLVFEGFCFSSREEFMNSFKKPLKHFIWLISSSHKL